MSPEEGRILCYHNNRLLLHVTPLWWACLWWDLVWSARVMIDFPGQITVQRADQNCLSSANLQQTSRDWSGFIEWHITLIKERWFQIQEDGAPVQSW